MKGLLLLLIEITLLRQVRKLKQLKNTQRKMDNERQKRLHLKIVFINETIILKNKQKNFPCFNSRHLKKKLFFFTRGKKTRNLLKNIILISVSLFWIYSGSL